MVYQLVSRKDRGKWCMSTVFWLEHVWGVLIYISTDDCLPIRIFCDYGMSWERQLVRVYSLTIKHYHVFLTSFLIETAERQGEDNQPCWALLFCGSGKGCWRSSQSTRNLEKKQQKTKIWHSCSVHRDTHQCTTTPHKRNSSKNIHHTNKTFYNDSPEYISAWSSDSSGLLWTDTSTVLSLNLICSKRVLWVKWQNWKDFG